MDDMEKEYFISQIYQLIIIKLINKTKKIKTKLWKDSKFLWHCRMKDILMYPTLIHLYENYTKLNHKISNSKK